MKKDLTGEPAVYFADTGIAGALSYKLEVPVKKIGRSGSVVRPAMLKKEIDSALHTEHVFVALSGNEYDSYLPKYNRTEYQSSGKYRIIRFSKSGGTK